MLHHCIRALCATLALTLSSASVAAPSAPGEVQAEEADERLERGLEAWRRGDWSEARSLLDDFVRDGAHLVDPLRTESALRHLADSTLFDETLPLDQRRASAREHILALMDRYPDWSPPPSTHGRAFYDLVAELREERAASQAADCEAGRLACDADLHELKVDHATLVEDHDRLQREFNEAKVPVIREVALNRGVALIPFGVGHFYNRNNALGATFLSAEVAFGATGLALMLDRIINLRCKRSGSSFAPGSLSCRPPDDVSDADVVLRRNLEQVFGFAFLGTLAIDIVVAQITFKKSRVVSRQEIRRKNLDDYLEKGGDPPAERRSRRPRARRRDDSVELRPVPAMIPDGAGLGLHLRF